MSGNTSPLPIEKPADSLNTMMADAAASVSYKYYVLMIIVFIFLMSDIFRDRIMEHIPSAVIGRQVTNYGTILQGILLVFAMIGMDFLIKNDAI
jgi:hypothetical protein